MKDILTAPFVEEMKQTTANMYRLGWDERNGGNISCLLREEELAEYLDTGKVLRTIPTGFDAKPLTGQYFIVTGTGKYFKNVEKDPETNLGIIRIAADGTTAELLWGYKDGGRFTSELPAHLMSHMARLEVDPENRVVMHLWPDRDGGEGRPDLHAHGPPAPGEHHPGQRDAAAGRVLRGQLPQGLSGSVRRAGRRPGLKRSRVPFWPKVCYDKTRQSGAGASRPAGKNEKERNHYG